MIIKELNVIEFGGLIGRRFELSSGLNIFEGDNEAGKSTLWLFIKFMLYGMPKKGHPERDRSINRMTHRAIGTMTLSVGGEEYRIERSFSENSRGKVSTLRLSDGEKVFAGEEPGEAMLGVPRDIFENSVAIGQGSCSGLGGEKGAAAIRNILSSADESVDVEKIQKKLGAIRVLYRHINGKGGKLFDLSQRKNLLEERLSAAVSSRLKINEIEEKLLKNEKNIDEAEKSLEVARSLVDNLGRREILQRFDALYENERSLRGVIDEREALLDRARRDGYIPLAVDGAALTAAADGYENAQRKLAEARRVYETQDSKMLTQKETRLAEVGEQIEAEGGVEKLLSNIKKARSKKTVGILLLCIGAAAVLLTVWNPLVLVGAPVGVILAVIGVILTVGRPSRGGVLGKLSKDERTEEYLASCVGAYEKARSYKRSLSDAEAALREGQGLAEYFQKELSRAMERVGANAPATLENARAEVRRVNSFVKEYNDIGVRIENLKGIITRERELLSPYDEAALRESMKDVEISDISVRAAEEKQRFYRESLAVLRDKGVTLKTELINIKARGEDPEALGDELEALRQEYDSAERTYEAVLTAIEGVDAAAAALRGSMTPTIGRNATELILGLTDGKYREVNVGRDLELTLIDGSELSTTSAMMSGGMRDGAYLALRIALMKNLFEGEAPPIMMDETLCQLDRTRTERALRMLDRISRDGSQTLLFTCHERERQICAELGIEAKILLMNEICD